MVSVRLVLDMLFGIPRAYLRGVWMVPGGRGPGGPGGSVVPGAMSCGLPGFLGMAGRVPEG